VVVLVAVVVEHLLVAVVVEHLLVAAAPLLPEELELLVVLVLLVAAVSWHQIHLWLVVNHQEM
jgi:hypothetical protein